MNTSRKFLIGGGEILPGYLHPTIELTEVNTEKGFCQSDGDKPMTEDPIEGDGF